MPIDPAARRALLEDQRARHIAFLQARVVSDAAKAEWRANMEAAWRELCARPVGELFAGPAVADAVEAAFSRDAVRAGLVPAVRSALLLASSRLREDDKAVGAYVPASLRPRIDGLLDERGIVPVRLLREVMEHDAVEEVMRDVLYDTLREFNDRVNPFFAEWGLPAFLGRLSPFGLGGMKKAFDSMRGEFDRRLEPEMRKFLQGFSRRALREFSSHTVAKIDEPQFVALRKRLAAWLLEQDVAGLVPPEGDRRAAKAEELAAELCEQVLAMPEVRAERRAAIELAVAAHAKQTLGEALAVYGVTHVPDWGAVADATWPLARAVLGGEAARAWLARLVSEFYEQELATEPP